MKARVQRWGNSLAIRIRKPYADEVGLRQDTPVDLILQQGELVLRPVSRRLDELLAGVTPENIHDEVDFGTPQGREAW